MPPQQKRTTARNAADAGYTLARRMDNLVSLVAAANRAAMQTTIGERFLEDAAFVERTVRQHTNALVPPSHEILTTFVGLHADLVARATAEGHQRPADLFTSASLELAEAVELSAHIDRLGGVA